MERAFDTTEEALVSSRRLVIHILLLAFVNTAREIIHNIKKRKSI